MIQRTEAEKMQTMNEEKKEMEWSSSALHSATGKPQQTKEN